MEADQQGKGGARSANWNGESDFTQSLLTSDEPELRVSSLQAKDGRNYDDDGWGTDWDDDADPGEEIERRPLARVGQNLSELTRMKLRVPSWLKKFTSHFNETGRIRSNGRIMASWLVPLTDRTSSFKKLDLEGEKEEDAARVGQYRKNSSEANTTEDERLLDNDHGIREDLPKAPLVPPLEQIWSEGKKLWMKCGPKKYVSIRKLNPEEMPPAAGTGQNLTVMKRDMALLSEDDIKGDTGFLTEDLMRVQEGGGIWASGGRLWLKSGPKKLVSIRKMADPLENP